MFNKQIPFNMKKFIVETYYTCTFKTVHSLDNLNDQELSKIDARSDGEVEVIDVKLNNRKTRKVGDKKASINKNKTKEDLLSVLDEGEVNFDLSDEDGEPCQYFMIENIVNGNELSVEFELCYYNNNTKI